MILGEQGNKTPKILACGPVGKLLLAIHCSVMMPDSFSTQKIAQVGISKYISRKPLELKIQLGASIPATRPFSVPCRPIPEIRRRHQSVPTPDRRISRRNHWLLNDLVLPGPTTATVQLRVLLAHRYVVEIPRKSLRYCGRCSSGKQLTLSTIHEHDRQPDRQPARRHGAHLCTTSRGRNR